MTRRRLRTAGVVVAALVVGGCGISQAVQPTAPTTTDAARNAVLPANRTYTVTLLTGDVVTVQTRQSGCPNVSVQPAKRSGGHQTFCGPDGHVQVIPASVTPLVGRVLDEDLFDVTTLIKEGYDDASSTDIPLIMRGGRNRTAAPALAGQRALPSIGAVAGRQPKSGGADFVAALAGQTTARSTEAPQVWLDHRVKATADSKTKLDANLRQVKAPQAWTRGQTGSGVRVAVLDTGVDATHPDLAGKVVEQADFIVEGGDAVDHFGHGTHVAATIAGSGAGSGGARRGVAPDAQLVIGKVLDDEGYGYDSGIIAGMEWAASRAKVVNMSFGGDPSDGTDPLSQAVDALSNQYGTLFVVSAGNSGPGESTVTAPATAATALAVGAVDSQDALADFSSRGPVVGSHALKPEIVAPGVDIVAARAAGTTMGTPVDAKYTRASGTSMAAPHVAGAAAIVAQAHPDWDASRLKAALVGSADATGADPYEAGAGRLNLPRAVGSVTTGTSPVNLGTFAYPQSGTEEAKVSWNNTGTKAVKLNLAVRLVDRTGKVTTDPALTLSSTSVTVPAGAGESAVLRLDRAKFGARPGFYTAMVTATWPGGGTASTPVSFYAEPETHELTVTATPPPGTTDGSYISSKVWIVNLDDPAVFASREEFDTVLRLRVPAGRYSVMGSVAEVDSASYELRRLALTGDSDVEVSSTTEVVMDAAAAKQAVAVVDGKDTVPSQMVLAFMQHPRRGSAWGAVLTGSDGVAVNRGLYATPTEDVGIGSFVGHQAYALDTVDRGTHYNLYRKLPGHIPAELTFQITAGEHAKLARIDQRFLNTDLPGAETTHRRMGESDDGLWLIEEFGNPIPPPTRVDYVSPGAWWTDSSGSSGISYWGAAWVETRQQYAAGSRQEKVWSRQPLRPDWFGEGTGLSGCLPPPIARTSTLLRVYLIELTDQHGRFTCLGPDDRDWGDKTSRSLTLYRNGQMVGTHASSIGDFPMSKEKANYRLTYDLDASAALPISTKVNTAWTFTSTGPTGTSDAAVPLLSVDYALPLDGNNHPTDGEAGFTVHQAPGTAVQKVTEFKAWTSFDDGATWTQVNVRKAADNRFTAQLPATSPGQAVSLRIAVAADGGSGMEQTILRAYKAA